MKLALFACFMFSSTAVHGQEFAELFLQFFEKWIPVNTNVDVMMLLDSSSSVSVANFYKGLDGIQFSNKMIDERTPSGINGQLDGTRSGYIQFAGKSDTAIVIHLPDFDNVFELNGEIASQIKTGGLTAMAKALRLAKKEFYKKNKNPGQPRRVLLVTDGFETEGGDPEKMASKLKDRGAEICVVAIGNWVKMNVLINIATKYPFAVGGLIIMRPCVVKAEDWIEFKTGMRKALRLLRKGK